MSADRPFIDGLAARLQQPLPGRDAQSPFAPDLSYGRQFGPPPATARAAAVIILLYQHEEAWYLPLTMRPAEIRSHAGQISLPGGTLEYGESSRHAALRELEEELAVGEHVELLGRLSDLYVFVSDFCVTPWVGVLDHRPPFVPNPHEVAEVIEVPLCHLTGPDCAGELLVQRGSLRFKAPCFRWRQHSIWGATSMILNELITIARDKRFLVHPAEAYFLPPG